MDGVGLDRWRHPLPMRVIEGVAIGCFLVGGVEDARDPLPLHHGAQRAVAQAHLPLFPPVLQNAGATMVSNDVLRLTGARPAAVASSYWS